MEELKTIKIRKHLKKDQALTKALPVKLDENTELAGATDVMAVQAESYFTFS